MEHKIENFDSRKEETLKFFQAQKIKELLASSADVNEDENLYDNEPSGDVIADHIRPFHPFPMVGQVRVLKDTSQLVYVLLAKKWDESSFLVIPFSSYSHPATDFELLVKNQGGLGLRVAQIWNARSLTITTLKNGWYVGNLPKEDIDDILSLWGYYVGGKSPSDDVVSRTGLPIFRRDDPRLKYQDEAIANFAVVDEKDILAVESGEDENYLIFKPASPFQKLYFTNNNCEYKLAAADAETVIKSDCFVDGFEETVRVQYEPSKNMLYLRVFGLDGNKSAAFDGWGVLGSQAEVLGYLSGGVFKVEVSEMFDGSLTLLDKLSNPHPLCEKEK